MDTYLLRIYVDEHDDVWADFGTTNARIRVYRSITGLVADRVLYDTIVMHDPTTDPPGSPTHEWTDVGEASYVIWCTYYDSGTGEESGYSLPRQYGADGEIVSAPGVLRFPVYLPDVNTLLASGLEVIRWQKAESDSSFDEYLDVSSNMVAAATVTGTEKYPFDIVGETAVFKVNRVSYEVTYTGTGTLSITDVVDQTNAVVPGLASSDVGKLKLTTSGSGVGESIQVTGSAAEILGFTDAVVWGKSLDLSLSTDVRSYEFVDPRGDDEAVYRYRLQSSDGIGYTDWVERGDVHDSSPLALSLLCAGFVRLVDADHTPLNDIDIIVTNPFSAEGVATVGSDYNIVGSRQTFTTDEFGFGFVWIKRGQVIDITLETTGFNRRVTIPDQQDVNLLDPFLGSGDIFEVTELDIPEAIRRTL